MREVPLNFTQEAKLLTLLFEMVLLRYSFLPSVITPLAWHTVGVFAAEGVVYSVADIEKRGFSGESAPAPLSELFGGPGRLTLEAV